MGYGLRSGLRVWVRTLGLGYGFGSGLVWGLGYLRERASWEITSGKMFGMENSGHEE